MFGDSVRYEHLQEARPIVGKKSHLEAHHVFSAHPVGSQSQDLRSVNHALAPGCASAGGTGELMDSSWRL